MGRKVFSTGEIDGVGLVCSFFSSSDVLNRRRVPALVGEGGFDISTRTDFGRYLGKAEVPLAFLGRRVEVRVIADMGCGVALSLGLGDCSSGESLWCEVETRLREAVLESGVDVLFEL